MKHKSLGLALAFVSVLCLAQSGAVSAESTWSAIKPAIFQERVIHHSRELIKLEAPYRTLDDRIIPIRVNTTLPGGRSIKSLTLIADDNPMPVIGVFRPASDVSSFGIGLNIRLDGTSIIRAVVETDDGSLYMTHKLVKTSGQGACASPPVSDLDKIDETIGQMAFNDVTSKGAATGFTSIARRGRLKLMHPNLTGLQMNQITLQHIPARYVDKLTVWQGKRELFSVESGITLSENPELEFEYRLDGSEDLTVEASDTEGTKFKSSFPLGPAS
ncbi:MAG: quinoprotein dehydrogenase-associated SoxYZ-like carrier [Alphaproteobacteria bacterium]|nr:quinoprotein dehydrogenase-associated SoxYZ-like carrier [Alphaproteobacteria bacterium]